MGAYHFRSKKEGFAILDRFGSVWSATLYPDEQAARQALVEKGYPIDDNFKIVPAHFELDKAEITPELV